jgi:NifU-like protein involved in Fe-S cluster formation
MDDLYREQILEHYKRPRNFARGGDSTVAPFIAERSEISEIGEVQIP